MITLTIDCSRCGKEVSHNMTDKTLSNDLIRKFGFGYAHNGKTNITLCSDCETQYGDLKDRLDTSVVTELRDFLNNNGEEDGHDGGADND